MICRALSPHKSSLLLLNKADLLPDELRSLWSQHLDTLGVAYAFWSASAAADADPAAAEVGSDSGDARTRILTAPQLIDRLAQLASDAVAAAIAAGEARPEGHTPTVGLVGFPNVGKSSTINAVFGSKKTAVAATPGKTKHFQTLFISEALLLCDCPGLVLPRLASSKADMVAAGARAPCAATRVTWASCTCICTSR